MYESIYKFISGRLNFIRHAVLYGLERLELDCDKKGSSTWSYTTPFELMTRELEKSKGPAISHVDGGLNIIEICSKKALQYTIYTLSVVQCSILITSIQYNNTMAMYGTWIYR